MAVRCWLLLFAARWPALRVKHGKFLFYCSVRQNVILIRNISQTWIHFAKRPFSESNSSHKTIDCAHHRMVAIKARDKCALIRKPPIHQWPCGWSVATQAFRRSWSDRGQCVLLLLLIALSNFRGTLWIRLSRFRSCVSLLRHVHALELVNRIEPRQ